MGRERWTLPGKLWLAPMAGVTDYAFRTVCAQLGAEVTVTEMVSSRALVYQDKKTKRLLRKNEGSTCGVQIFGNDPAIMAEAAKLVLEYTACDFIDINMGCPMPKVANSGDGCGLMRTPQLAGQIVRAVADVVPVPVCVKMRTGWDKGSINCVELAQIVQDNGAAAVTVHGRTRSMLYSGVADWDQIRKVREAIEIPVVANGDVVDAQSALRCLARTGADGLMLGRGTFGDPWLFAEVQAALRGENLPQRPPLAQRMDLAEHQFELACADKGEHIGCLEARKYFSWYLRGVAHSSYYKAQISKIAEVEDAHRILAQIRRDLK